MMDFFLFDLDGTLTLEELLPKIARELGVWNEIYELTQQTIAGDIPFEASLRYRVEILNKAKVSDIRKIVSRVQLNPSILKFIQSNRERCYIVTGNLDVWIADLIKYINVPVLCSNAIVENDHISSISNIIDKKKASTKFSGSFCAIGEGANDYGMFELAHKSIAFGGVHEPARPLLEVATYLTYDSETLCKILSRL